MATVSVRDVQHNLASILRRVEAGEEIEVCRRRKPVARLLPATPVGGGKANWADLAAWRSRTWGGRPTPGTPVEALVADSRGDR
jgi:prevent-host-death family protein